MSDEGSAEARGGAARLSPLGEEPECGPKGYRPAGYRFLHQALLFTRVRLGRESHVSGGELLDGLRDLALEQFGPLARLVLEHWGITSTEDVGAMVKRLVDRGVWSRREEDSWDDFRGGYDFREVFEEKYPWRAREALGIVRERCGGGKRDQGSS